MGWYFYQEQYVQRLETNNTVYLILDSIHPLYDASLLSLQYFLFLLCINDVHFFPYKKKEQGHNNYTKFGRVFAFYLPHSNKHPW
jgi:hypothetical protein